MTICRIVISSCGSVEDISHLHTYLYMTMSGSREENGVRPHLNRPCINNFGKFVGKCSMIALQRAPVGACRKLLLELLPEPTATLSCFVHQQLSHKGTTVHFILVCQMFYGDQVLILLFQDENYTLCACMMPRKRRR